MGDATQTPIEAEPTRWGIVNGRLNRIEAICKRIDMRLASQSRALLLPTLLAVVALAMSAYSIGQARDAAAIAKGLRAHALSNPTESHIQASEQ